VHAAGQIVNHKNQYASHKEGIPVLFVVFGEDIESAGRMRVKCDDRDTEGAMPAPL
jgi:hypothetical protein